MNRSMSKILRRLATASGTFNKRYYKALKRGYKGGVDARKIAELYIAEQKRIAQFKETK